MDIKTASAERIRHAAQDIRDIIQRLDIGVVMVTLNINSFGLALNLHGGQALAVVSGFVGSVTNSRVTDQGRDFTTASVHLDGVDVTAFGK